MAGCQPEHFPVVAAAISAVSDRTYNLHASSTSTNGITNLVVVSGPYASRIGMNCGTNLMGNGNRANARHRAGHQPSQNQLLRVRLPGNGQEHLRTLWKVQLLFRREP